MISDISFLKFASETPNGFIQKDAEELMHRKILSNENFILLCNDLCGSARWNDYFMFSVVR
jgi:hypothetical protein